MTEPDPQRDVAIRKGESRRGADAKIENGTTPKTPAAVKAERSTAIMANTQSTQIAAKSRANNKGRRLFYVVIVKMFLV